MVPREILESMSTASLDQKQRLSNFALNTVWFGAAFAIIATVIQGAVSGVFPGMTLNLALIALLASAPVHFERKVILEILAERR